MRVSVDLLGELFPAAAGLAPRAKGQAASGPGAHDISDLLASMLASAAYTPREPHQALAFANPSGDSEAAEAIMAELNALAGAKGANLTTETADDAAMARAAAAVLALMTQRETAVMPTGAGASIEARLRVALAALDTTPASRSEAKTAAVESVAVAAPNVGAPVNDTTAAPKTVELVAPALAESSPENAGTDAAAVPEALPPHTTADAAAAPAAAPSSAASVAAEMPETAEPVVASADGSDTAEEPPATATASAPRPERSALEAIDAIRGRRSVPTSTGRPTQTIKIQTAEAASEAAASAPRATGSELDRASRVTPALSAAAQTPAGHGAAAVAAVASPAAPADHAPHTGGESVSIDAPPEWTAEPSTLTELPSRLVESMQVQLRAGGGTAEIRLTPAFLGAVHVTVTVDRGAVKASVSAETAAGLNALKAEIAGLREALEERGLRLDEFEIREEPWQGRDFDDPQQDEPSRPTPEPPVRRANGTEDFADVFDVVA
jgi:flagellar hook-length control protein FliK